MVYNLKKMYAQTLVKSGISFAVASRLALVVKFDQIFALALLKSGVSFVVACRLVLVQKLTKF